MAVYNKSEEMEYVFKNLGKSEEKKEKLFDSMKDVYMLAFMIGAINNDKLPIEKNSQDPIKDVYFSRMDRALMSLIGLYLSKDIKILNKSADSEEYIHDLVEQYANAGIYKIDEMLNNNHFDLDNLISAVKNYENILEPKKANIADVIYEQIQKLTK